MSQQHNAPKAYTEADIQLTISDIQSERFKSERRAAAIYNVPRITVRRRRDGQRY
jgi:hypothetical protein